MRVGVLGAGQLGRMLALSGYPLGLRFLFVDPAPSSPAGELAEQIVLPYEDERAQARLAECDVVTFEFENVPLGPVQALAKRALVYPPPAALAVAQDRLAEKTTFSRLGIPTPRFSPVNDPSSLAAALDEVGLPAVLKTRRMGYDGKGQAVIRERSEAEPALRGLSGVPLILESFVPFSRELSMLAVRSKTGETRFYPPVENEHEGGILRLSRAPARGVSDALTRAAEGHAQKLLDDLGYVGVLALELFEVEGQLLANEVAPRVHNSGHFSIEGARTSQFENHLRALLGLPLGSTDALGPSAMVNLIGQIPDRARLLAIPDAHLHDYGKAGRPQRKVGHVTVRAQDAPTLEARIAEVRALLGSEARNG
jgi:5-(carboxyamino)imidazole ribonucleotide synthase